MTYQQFIDNFDRFHDYWPISFMTFLAYTFICLFISVSDYNIGVYSNRSLLNLHKRTGNKMFLIVNHVVSLIFQFQFGLFTLWYHNVSPSHYSSEDTLYTSEMDRINFAILIGYFTYDTIALLIHVSCIEGSRFDTMTVIHHFFAIGANIYALTQDIDGYFMIQGTLLLESSNPNYQIYRIIQHTKYNLGIFDTINKACFFITYSFLRIGFGLHLCMYLWFHNKSTYCQVLGNAGAFISLWWYREIIQWLFSAFNGKKAD